MTEETRATQIRVGLFLAVGVAMAGSAIFVLGQNSGVFERKTTLYAYFPDVSGLVEGAPVRVAGLDVGTVDRVEFANPPSARKARVTLLVKSKYLPQLRTDSVVIIDSKGLLGDKLVNISMGSPNATPISDGATLPSRAAASFEQLAGKLDKAISAVTKVTETADEAIRQISTEDARADIGRIMASTARIMERVENGPGFAHRFFYDPRYGEEVAALLGAARGALVGVGDAARRVDRALAEVESGKGMAHEIVYGDSGRATMLALRNAATEIANITGQVRSGDGLLHALIYEPEHRRALEELNQAATRINGIMANVEAGRGTLGGLLVDPTVYEDLTTMLGNINRNVLLKALIRFTIKEGDIERPARSVTRVNAGGESSQPAARAAAE
jgi:phospholipid/cholesterol/gamma-HCH transport system substrate-binding protein